MENKNVTSIALHRDFINKITLHNTEYYDAIENGVLVGYEIGRASCRERV